MKKQAWYSYAFWIILSEAVGVFSGLLSKDGMEIFRETVIQPPLSPPDLLFPIVWTILYLLMGIGAARIAMSPAGSARATAKTLFLLQLLVNFIWTPIFFQLQAHGAALGVLLLLWVLVLRMILSFHKADKLAAKLQYPYLIWLTFAAYLNLGVWLLNR